MYIPFDSGCEWRPKRRPMPTENAAQNQRHRQRMQNRQTRPICHPAVSNARVVFKLTIRPYDHRAHPARAAAPHPHGHGDRADHVERERDAGEGVTGYVSGAEEGEVTATTSHAGFRSLCERRESIVGMGSP
jgi:hypothetical protein